MERRTETKGVREEDASGRRGKAMSGTSGKPSRGAELEGSGRMGRSYPTPTLPPSPSTYQPTCHPTPLTQSKTDPPTPGEKGTYPRGACRFP